VEKLSILKNFGKVTKKLINIAEKIIPKVKAIHHSKTCGIYKKCIALIYLSHM
jgi:hypothetical protein